MGLYCLISPGGSPGVTTTGVGLALGWPREVVLAECDPGGRSVLPGFLADRLHGPPGPGLLGLAMAVGREGEAARVEEFTLPLAEDGRAWLLHGIRDPRHAQQLARLWPRLAGVFTSCGMDVIADLGRVGGTDTPFGLVAGADLVVMVLRPTLGQVDAAQPRLNALLGMVGGRVPVGLCLTGSGPYTGAQVSKALSGLPVLAELPHAPADARVLSEGAPPRLTFRTSLLVRALRELGHQMRKAVEERAFHSHLPAGTAGGAR